MTKERSPAREPGEIMAVVLGLGAVGRLVAQQLAALHVGELHLVDDRLVAPRDAPARGYFAADVGRHRIHATAQLCHELNPELAVPTHRRLRKRWPVGAAFFICPDSGQICRPPRRSDQGFIGAAFVRDSEVYVQVVSARTADSHRDSLGIQPGSGTLAVAAIAAGLLVDQFHCWLTGHTPATHIRLDLIRRHLDVQPA